MESKKSLKLILIGGIIISVAAVYYLNNQTKLLQPQNKTEKKEEEDCTINTQSLSPTNGVAMMAYYPCTWSFSTVNNNNFTFAAQALTTINRNCSLSMLLTIMDIGEQLSESSIDEATSEEYLREKATNYGEFISINKTSIDGVKGDELVTEKKLRSGATMYSHIAHFYYKNFLITLTYAVTSPLKDEAYSIFQQYKTNFKKLIYKTDFEN